MSDSATPWTLARSGSPVHGILQARILILLGESETEGLKLCRKGDPLQRVGYLTLRNDLLEEASALTEEEAESGREPGGRQLGRGPGRAALPCGSQSQVLW